MTERRRALPGVLSFWSGFLIVLLETLVSRNIAAAYGPAVALHAGFVVFLLLALLFGCLSASAIDRLGPRRGIVACGVLLMLSLAMTQMPAPAAAWGPNPLVDCLSKCLVFYGLGFSALAAVPVMVSTREDADAPLRHLGIFCLGAGVASALFSPLSAHRVGWPVWTGLFAFFAMTALIYLARSPVPPRSGSPQSAHWHVGAAGAAMAAAYMMTQYMLLLTGDSAIAAAAQVLLFGGLAVCLVPLRLRLRAGGLMICAIGGVALYFSPGHSSYCGFELGLLALMLLLWGRWLCWLQSPMVDLNRFCIMLAWGAVAGAVVSWDLILLIEGSRPKDAGPLAHALAMGASAVWGYWLWRGRRVCTAKSEFGTNKVFDNYIGQRVLMNRHANHGSQSVESGEEESVPLAYFGSGSPAGRFLKQHPFPRVAMLGLGVGAACAYAAEGSRWTVYELDPGMVRIAQTYFSFLRRCKGGLDIVVGDAGKTFAAAPDAEFDLILIDVFSGHHIPEHMVSEEAARLYRRKLKEGGALLVHTTGHAEELAQGLGRHVMDMGLGLVAKNCFDWHVVHSSWLIAARDAAMLNELAGSGWTPVKRQG